MFADIALLLLALVFGILASVFLFLYLRFLIFRLVIRQELRKKKVERMHDVGTVSSLEILPLVDWYPARENLRGASGVSYLVRTEKETLLFDAGYGGGNQSPLAHNMRTLGVSLTDFSGIVISHNHMDHTSGLPWISSENERTGLPRKRLFFPGKGAPHGFEVVDSIAPTRIASGIATLGTIPNADFFFGRIDEQALAVNVSGKGIVLVVGCGHQGLARILERAEALFDGPLYGIIGGLHYPVTDSRVKVRGVGIQKYVATCKTPLVPITMAEVKRNIEVLKKRNPRIVALSAHDSCDAVLREFREAFGEAYAELRAGKKIVI